MSRVPLGTEPTSARPPVGGHPVELAVRARGLAKRFGRTWALRDVSLEVRAGACVLVLGPNGAGKSTLLALAATLLRPTAGSLEVFGRSTVQETQAVRTDVGLVSHEPMLYPHLSVRENLLLFAQLSAVEAPGERVAKVLEAFALEEWAGEPVASLSHGTVQRAALARAFLARPRLLLLDEPLAGLDEAGRGLLRDALLRAHARGVTVILTAHEWEALAGLPDTVAVLVAGELRGWAERPGWTEADLRDFYHQSLLTPQATGGGR